MKRRVVTRQVLIGLWWMAASLSAQSPPAYQVQLENDVFAGTDIHYTNSLEIGAMRHRVDLDRLPFWGRALARKILESGSFCSGGCQVNEGWSIGHTIYTPENLTVSRLIRNDRPYAAWLRYTSQFQVVNEEHVHDFRGSLGLVGEAALGDEIQSGLHEIIDSAEPRGWDNQLDNEPVVQLTYRYRYRPFEAFADEDRTNRIFDVFPHATGTLGNAFVYGGVGGTLRLGTICRFSIPTTRGPRLRTA